MDGLEGLDGLDGLNVLDKLKRLHRIKTRLRFISLGKFWMLSDGSEKCIAFSISVWRAVNSVQCVV